MKHKATNLWRQGHSAFVKAFVMGCMLAFLAYAGDGTAADTSEAKHPAANATGTVVVAIVNGEAILEGELNAGLPRTWLGLGATDTTIKAAKYERLISAAVVRQFLARSKITVSNDTVTAEIEALRKTPPAAGCSCCRYASLEQFMRDQGYDMDELRRAIVNDIGMNKYLTAEWDKNSLGVEKASDQVEARVRSEYVKASHIFFNTFQKPDFQENPDKVLDVAWSNARDAQQRLARGEKFEDVAATMSDDAMSNTKGGLLGCIPRNAFGSAFSSAVDDLKPGKSSKPIETQWGIHIIRRETMTDADILKIIRDEYVADNMETTLRRLLDAAKVERLWRPK